MDKTCPPTNIIKHNYYFSILYLQCNLAQGNTTALNSFSKTQTAHCSVHFLNRRRPALDFQKINISKQISLLHTLNPFLNLLTKLNHPPLFFWPDFGHAVNSNYEDDYRSIVLGFFNQTNTFSNY